jgi:hypothetical protein
MVEDLNNLANWPRFASLAIGSVPCLTTEQALRELARLDIPASPQMVKVSFYEDMLLGAADGLPFIQIQENERRLVAREKDLADNLALFYERFYAGDFSFLALGEKSSEGLRAFLQKAKVDPSFGASYLKAQVVGPITFAQSTRLDNGNSAVDQPDILEALSFGLGAKAAYLASLIRDVNRSALVFIDEPGLSGYGSAFSTLSAETILKSLGRAIETAKSQGPVMIGCHVCGNTDWGLLARAPLDVLNFDAFNHMEAFCLYPKELKDFLERGGFVAWGLAPTENFDPAITAELLLDRFWAGVKPLWRYIDRDLLMKRSLFSPSCGLGSLPMATARNILIVVAELSELARVSS